MANISITVNIAGRSMPLKTERKKLKKMKKQALLYFENLYKTETQN